MSKRGERARRAQLLDDVRQLTVPSNTPDTDFGDGFAPGSGFAPGGHSDTPVDDAQLAVSSAFRGLDEIVPGVRRPLVMMKKFRFQLLHAWMTEHIGPCRAADIGGGKGLMAYLLGQSGWETTVIDPVSQRLPEKYKDLSLGRQVKIAETERVARIDAEFAPEMADHFDLLLAMHAHGCNFSLIDAAAERGSSFVSLPCCVIGEPKTPPPGTHWLVFVAEHAKSKGFDLTPFRLNFKGQNIGLYGTMQ